MATGLCGTCGGSTPGCGCHVTAGARVAVTGDGSSGSPFVVTADQTIVNAGARATVSGAGTAGSPYVVAADQTVVTAGTNASVTGAGTAGSPYVINAASQAPVAGSGIAVSGSTVTAKNRLQLANPVRNASFNIWQRGTSIALTSGASQYCADGWKFTSGNSASVVSQQDAVDTQGSGSCMRWIRNSGQTGTTALSTGSSVITANALKFAGRQVTFSFRARCGANYSAASSALGYLLYTGTATDGSVHAGYTGQASPISGSATLTTSWQTFSATVTLNSNVRSFAPYFNFTPVGTAGAADYYELKDVRVDEGPYVIDHVAPDYAADFYDAQRYFWRVGGLHTAEHMGNAIGASTTSAYAYITYPVIMRATPTATYPTASLLALSDGTASTALTVVATQEATARLIRIVCTTASGLAQYRPFELHANASLSGYIDFSAEI